MVAAGSVREQIEDALARRAPGALSPQQRVVFPQTATGIPTVDTLLGGGLPGGAISEVTGSSCSGRTSFALVFVAGLTRAGRATAWIDVVDAFDPESAAAAGVDLNRQLWIRCGSKGEQPGRDRAQASDAPGMLCGETPRNPTAVRGGSPHPRYEVRGMPEAIQALLQHGPPGDSENPAAARRQRRNIGTPGMLNRQLRTEVSDHARRAFDRTEQAPTDRQPPRRGEHFDRQPRPSVPSLPYCTNTPTMRGPARQANAISWPGQNKDALHVQIPAFCKGTDPKRSGIWTALDQAIRSADLLLNAGGFAALILDLGSTLHEFVGRIPMATWFRFRAAAERSRTTVLLLTQHPCARSSAGLVLQMKALSATTAGNLLTGMSYEVSVSRQRFKAVKEPHQEVENIVTMHKPPQSERCTTWSRNMVWSLFAEWEHEKTVLASTNER